MLATRRKLTMRKVNLILVTITVFLFACSPNGETPEEDKDASTSYQNSSSDADCKFDDGTYSATVDYDNPNTGYSATYTLSVDVQDCQVVQINFPNDGYLDEDHISAADIDEDGHASVDGEDGKTYEIQIE
jgi:hypothetical protein